MVDLRELVGLWVIDLGRGSGGYPGASCLEGADGVVSNVPEYVRAYPVG